MKHTCVVCGQQKEQNLVILGKAICADCEWKIVVARVHEKGYENFVKAAKQLRGA